MEAQSPWMPTVKLGRGRSVGSLADGVKSGVDKENGAGEFPQRPAWQAWQSYLLDRPARPSLRKLLSTAHECPWLWCLTDRVSPEDQGLMTRLRSVKRKGDKSKTAKKNGSAEIDWNREATDWLCQFQMGGPNVSADCCALVWANTLPKLAARIEESLWWQLLEALAEHSSQARVGNRGTMLTTQLAGGELGMTLAYWFPELPACFDARTRARQLVAESLLEATDGEGVLHASHFDDMRPLLACWTRCIALDRELKKGKLGREARNQFDWLLRQALRFTRPDGSAVLSDPELTEMTFSPLAEAALRLNGDEEDRCIADCVLPVAKSRRAKALRIVAPDASEHSEWSELALLQTNWEPYGPSCAVLYPQGRFRIELRNEAKLLLTGPLTHELEIDGRKITSDLAWEEICWLSDQDVDYLELEADLGDDWRLQRQFLLAHDDEFLFFADAILGPHAANLQYRVGFPLANRCQLSPVEEHTEVHLHHGNTLAACTLPLGLSEWRSAVRHGSWRPETAELHHSGSGSALYAPLFLDLSSARRGKPLTWRQLTVAGNLAIVSPDVAVGYRVQIGDEQWLFYRSLAPAASRTVLGQNLGCDFFAARFGQDGEAEELVEIES